MGRDKAALRVAGATLLESAAAAFTGLAGETLLACGPTERYRDLGFPLVLDAFPDAGPLAGLEAGLARARTEWLAALACDMPRATPEVVRQLLERAQERDLDVCFLRTEKGIEPLFAVYRRTCLEPVRAALQAGERKLVSFLRFKTSDGRRPRSGNLLEADLPGGLAAAGVAHNLNTPEDLRAEIGPGGRA